MPEIPVYIKSDCVKSFVDFNTNFFAVDFKNGNDL